MPCGYVPLRNKKNIFVPCGYVEWNLVSISLSSVLLAAQSLNKCINPQPCLDLCSTTFVLHLMEGLGIYALSRPSILPSPMTIYILTLATSELMCAAWIQDNVYSSILFYLFFMATTQRPRDAYLNSSFKRAFFFMLIHLSENILVLPDPWKIGGDAI